MSKAWVCYEDDEYLHVYHTPDRNQARMFAASDIGMDYVDVRVYRCPAMDDLPVSARNMLLTGTCSWYECQGCSNHIYADGYGPIAGIASDVQAQDPTSLLVSNWRGQLWCSDACYQTWYERWGKKEATA